MNLREIRESEKLTQEQLAAVTTLDQTTISAIERGQVVDPRSSTVKALARGLNRSPEEIENAIRESVKEAA